ncbi:MAG: hypothetical protein SFV19_13895 [Rhodospirillaceae bacterium]|nr:hypothetical protein [Rhodospirillaceae bacterium]
MTKQLQRRVDKLEHPPGAEWPLVHFIEGPMDMSLETALEMLNCEPLPHEPVIYLGILPLGERPRHGADPSPISDEDWARLKDSYERKAGWWNKWNGHGTWDAYKAWMEKEKGDLPPRADGR